mmetsp:Transcript_16638/g.35999  ORF Transcript_16638/g.35999 Transcript_16638/m.35999 type:complete len:302 (+) Transcript_16638:683-1588(+)
MVACERLAVHLVCKQHVPCWVHGHLHRYRGRIDLLGVRVLVQAHKVDVRHTRILLRQACFLENIPQHHASPCGVTNGSSVPVQALDRLDLLHLTAPVAGALDGGRQRVLLEPAHQLLQAVLTEAHTLALDAQLVVLDVHLGHWQVVADVEEVCGRDEVCGEDGGRGFGVVRPRRAGDEDRVACRVLGIGVLDDWGWACCGSGTACQLADLVLRQDLLDLCLLVLLVDGPEGLDGASRCQHDLLHATRVGVHKGRDVVHVALVGDPDAGALVLVLSHLCSCEGGQFLSPLGRCSWCWCCWCC